MYLITIFIKIFIINKYYLYIIDINNIKIIKSKYTQYIILL